VSFLKVRVKSLEVPIIWVVRMRGLEPPRLAAPDPKSGFYTNYN